MEKKTMEGSGRFIKVTPQRTTWYVRTFWDFDAEELKAVFERDQEKPPAKRRKTAASYKPAEEVVLEPGLFPKDRLIIVNREITLVIPETLAYLFKELQAYDTPHLINHSFTTYHEDDGNQTDYSFQYLGNGELGLFSTRYAVEASNVDLPCEMSFRSAIRASSAVKGWNPYHCSYYLRIQHNDVGGCALILNIQVSVEPIETWNRTTLDLAIKHHKITSGPRPSEYPISVTEFYDCLHTPDRKELVPPGIQPDMLKCELLPFQRRTVQWMLRREGVSLQIDGTLHPYNPQESREVPLLFKVETDLTGHVVYESHLLGMYTRNIQAARGALRQLRGGILAEEMGLGKTVEIAALISLHKRAFTLGERINFEGRQIQITGATLIVCPMSILKQWMDEIRRHAPDLRIFHYTGLAKSFHESTNQEVIDVLSGNDIVFITYSELSKEIHYARAPPTRTLRRERNKEPRRSPLVEMSWWRICLDEAQMALGFSHAAEIARQLPRANSWIVSGTPIKTDVNDCQGHLMFLQVEPFSYHRPAFRHMIHHHHDAFADLFGFISLRHSKAMVSDELKLPPQSRVVVTVPFTPIEKENYDTLFKEMCQILQLNEVGEPTASDSIWDPKMSYTEMRSWLNHLRRICIHLGAVAREGGANTEKNNPKTVQEVLFFMIEQQISKMRSNQRELYMKKVQRGQLHEQDKKPRQAVEIWEKLLYELERTVKECKEELQKEILDLQKEDGSNDTGVEKRRGEIDALVGDDDIDATDSEMDEVTNVKSRKHRVAKARMRLRGFLEVKHSCIYWIATGYHQLASEASQQLENGEIAPEEQRRLNSLVAEYKEKEDRFYSEAQNIRRELMTETRGRALRFMNELGARRDPKHPMHFFDVHIMEPLPEVGIQAHRHVVNVEPIVAALNKQAHLLNKWRYRLCELLQTPLFDSEMEEKEVSNKEEGENENHGDEHEKAVILQEQCYTYIFALREVMADRQDTLSGDISYIHFERRNVFANEKGLDSSLFDDLIRQKGNDYYPIISTGLRNSISEFRSLINGFKLEAANGSDRSAKEVELAEPVLNELVAAEKEHNKISGILSREMQYFRGALNARIEFYRQLQYVSDTLLPIDVVATYNRPAIDESLFNYILRHERELTQSIDQARARIRYLQHLQGPKTAIQTSPDCLICMSPYQTGVMTTCGHSVCSDCMRRWLRNSRTCPECRFPLRGKSSLYQISYQPSQTKMLKQSESPNNKNNQPAGSRLLSNSLFSVAGETLIRKINAIKLPFSYGSKIDMIVRHLLYLQRSEPGTKAVVFSQWSYILDVIKVAISTAGICYCSLQNEAVKGSRDNRARARPLESNYRWPENVATGWSGGVEEFKSDPNITCFLLHAKSQAAGLTLVNATHVFLCEPLVNVPLELQAISRVHRIGQKKPTTVWVYTVEGTVEEGVLELSTKRRLEMIGKEDTSSRELADEDSDVNMKDFDEAYSAELKGPLAQIVEKSPNGGEVVPDDDLWSCLFSAVIKRHRTEKKNQPIDSDNEEEGDDKDHRSDGNNNEGDGDENSDNTGEVQLEVRDGDERTLLMVSEETERGGSQKLQA